MREFRQWHGLLQKRVLEVQLAAPQVRYADYQVRLVRLRAGYGKPHTQVTPHQHSFYEGILTLGGAARKLTGAGGELAPGTVQLHTPGVVHGWSTGETGIYRLGIWFTCTPAIRVPATACGGCSPPSLHLIDTLLTEEPDAPGWPDRAHAYLTLLLAPLLALGQRAGAIEPPGASFSPTIAEIAERFVRDNLAHPITLADIAEHVGVSIPTLTRQLRAQHGVSAMGLLQSLRMEQAMALLQHTDQPLGPIAAAVGFADPAYFCRCFKAYTHQTPTAYREHSRTRAREEA
jgi:AraC family transcriptional activator of pobA